MLTTKTKLSRTYYNQQDAWKSFCIHIAHDVGFDSDATYKNDGFIVNYAKHYPFAVFAVRQAE